MIADVASYGETVLHIGIDHQFKEDLMTGKQEGLAGFNSNICGGKVFAAGFRYHFGF